MLLDGESGIEELLDDELYNKVLEIVLCLELEVAS